MRRDLGLEKLGWHPVSMIAIALLLAFFQSPSPRPPATVPTPELEFRCMLAVSLDRHVVDRWNHTAGSEGVSAPSTGRVVRKQYFTLYPFFGGVASDDQGRERVRIDVKIIKPDGKPYYEAADMDGHDAPAGRHGGVLLSKELITACFEPEDALGRYEIEVTARDVVSGRSSTAKHALQLVEYADGADFDDDEELEAWFGGYFERPAPERAIPALLAYCANGWESEKPHDARGFLREVFEDNHWLFTELFARFESLDESTRRAVLWLLARSSCESKAFVKELGQADRALWKAIGASFRDPVAEPISSRVDLNEVWSMYLASRRYVLIERLCAALAPGETGVVDESTIRNEELEVDVPLRMVVPTVVAGMLRELARTDAVTRAYLEWTRAHESTPKGVRKELALILDE